MVKTIKGKCPQCCPDGGAIFDNWVTEKECRNCGLRIQIRKIKPSGKPTASQERTLKLIVDTFGGVLKTCMIGRKLWLELVNRERNWMLGDSLHGIISVNGRFEIKLQRLGGDAVITDEIGINVYLKDYQKI